MSQPIGKLRKEYEGGELHQEDLTQTPYGLFDRWFKEVLETDIEEPNAMTLATVTAHNAPAARIVLLKGYDEDGFIFFSNYESRKGKEIASNPHVALVFYWRKLERQIRIEGIAHKLSAEASTKYFQSRPKGSQIGAWASNQSRIIADRSTLSERVRQLEAEYENKEVLPRPDFWGGYRVEPYLVEFWQGRKNRLHDRFEYRLSDHKAWMIKRLSP